MEKIIPQALSSKLLTLYTNSGQDPDPTAKSNTPLFEAGRFKDPSPDEVGSYLREKLKLCISRDRVLIIVVCASLAEPSDRLLLDILSDQIGGLPHDLFKYVNPHREQGQSVAALPSHDQDQQDFTFLLNYPTTTADHLDSPTPALDFEDRKVCFQGTASLICPSSRLDKTRPPTEPMITLYMPNLLMLPRLESHLAGPENTWRLSRLLHSPLWIYIDLFQSCGDWSEVWSVALRDLARRDAQAYQASLCPSTLHLTRRLHRAISNVITLRENLRLHISSMERFLGFVTGGRVEWCAASVEGDEGYTDTLAERTREILMDLEYHRDTSVVVLEQFNSLLSLVFNTETVTQGQAVARLNVLAFAFLPLSFVSGLFGMTTWSISAVWYPLWALVAFVLITAAAYISGKLSFDRSEGQTAILNLHWKSERNSSMRSENVSHWNSTVPVTVIAKNSTHDQKPVLVSNQLRYRNSVSRHARRLADRFENIGRSSGRVDSPHVPSIHLSAPANFDNVEEIDSVSETTAQEPDVTSNQNPESKPTIAENGVWDLYARPSKKDQYDQLNNPKDPNKPSDIATPGDGYYPRGPPQAQGWGAVNFYPPGLSQVPTGPPEKVRTRSKMTSKVQLGANLFHKRQ
ncbi:uncharacterized protein N7511_005392 [Penicillium nucicola]|uniref:uncharacterized protein n=1 Tax=Penicillium nucicola TaxID=1850975 RepID=UPI002545095F|nr:uncharacterized protein N7511_005392 [Penicillium nucicola]KAJ5762010.1 hypothetical protein N7511_005392 [Penicillium nucicola]